MLNTASCEAVSVRSQGHLAPPGRRRVLPLQHSLSSSSSDNLLGEECGDGGAAEKSFRAEQEYFGPDVLVLVGLLLACVGGVLTLVSSYVRFRHPAIQATVAGIGPSLVGIGLLFCVLRLFFCSFCISRTCCDCIADALLRSPCCRPARKKVHPIQVKDAIHALNGFSKEKKKLASNGTSNGQPAFHAAQPPPLETVPSAPQPWKLSPSAKMDPISEAEGVPEVCVEAARELLEDSPTAIHHQVSELVLKSRTRY